MDIAFIEAKINEIIAELEKEVLEIVSDESLDRRETNLRMKPLSATKKILLNALDSIKMVQTVSEEEKKA